MKQEILRWAGAYSNKEEVTPIEQKLGKAILGTHQRTRQSVFHPNYAFDISASQTNSPIIIIEIHSNRSW
jgi:hypothetical protein